MKCLAKKDWVDLLDRQVKIILKSGVCHTATFQGMSKMKCKIYAVQEDGKTGSWDLSAVDCLIIL